MTRANGTTATALAPVSNDGAATIEFSTPYRVEVTLTGTSDILFHRWSCEGVEEKSKAAKGSTAKKTDNIESYVYRCADKTLGVPGEYVRQSIIMAAKYRQDPRSSRKSAMDLFKAGIVSLTDVATIGTANWDYLSKMRVRIGAACVTRERPAMRAGWTTTVILLVLTPEYINPMLLKSVLEDAGRLVGIADNRPTYGRFTITRFDVLDA